MSEANDPMRSIEGNKKKGLWKPQYSRFRRRGLGNGPGKGDFNRALDNKDAFDRGYEEIDWSK